MDNQEFHATNSNIIPSYRDVDSPISPPTSARGANITADIDPNLSNISNRLQDIGKFSGYLSREKFSSIKKSNSFCDLTSQKIESVNIKSKCVFDAAFKDILQQINEDGEVSIEEVISTIQLYQSASDVVKTFFPNSKPSKKFLTSLGMS